jgi:hypothetical protein
MERHVCACLHAPCRHELRGMMVDALEFEIEVLVAIAMLPTTHEGDPR